MLQFDIALSNGHFINQLNTRRANNLNLLSFLGTSNSRSQWNMGLLSPPTIANAFHLLIMNQICKYVLRDSDWCNSYTIAKKGLAKAE